MVWIQSMMKKKQLKRWVTNTFGKFLFLMMTKRKRKKRKRKRPERGEKEKKL